LNIRHVSHRLRLLAFAQEFAGVGEMLHIRYQFIYCDIFLVEASCYGAPVKDDKTIADIENMVDIMADINGRFAKSFY
jgi:hypothetical protein